MSGASRRARCGGGGGCAAEAVARLVLVAVLLHSLVQCAGANTENNARLTTSFGKSQQKPQENSPPKPLDGLPCNKSSDCSQIENTTCLIDPRDYRMRCLCGDKTVPQAAVCRNKRRIVRFPCSSTSECVENADCMPPSNINVTAGEAVQLNIPTSTSPNFKICWCREGYFPADDDHCSNKGKVLLPSVLLLLASLQVFLIPSRV